MRYPIGIQTFKNIRADKEMLYVDKTAVIHQMVSTGKCNFLCRPRRFGKSLLVSTLKEYFEGNKQLFTGLAMEKLETEWVQYPVLRFDMSGGKHYEKEQLEYYLLSIIKDEERRHGIEPNDEEKNANVRIANLINKLYAQTGKQVVVLIDEYDSPLLDVVHDEKRLEVLRNVMRNFYSPLKKCDESLHFVFITGITKFSQLSIFSELNNLRNISLDPRFAAICGITEEELVTQMSPDIDAMAAANEMSREEAIADLKANYDGYHFAWPSPDVYNPFSLVYGFDRKSFDNFWFETGTPTALIEILKRYGCLPAELNSPLRSTADDFNAPTEKMSDLTPFLYQSGYLTIKGKMRGSDIYMLGIPNNEIREGLFNNLLNNYVFEKGPAGRVMVEDMRLALYDDDMDGALRLLQTYLYTVPQTNNTDYEGHYQQMLYVIFTLVGINVDVEVHTPTGRIDMVVRTAKTLYVVELKLNKSAQTAMTQIDLKNYDKRFALCGLPVVKVGVNFNSETRNIEEWEIEGAE